MCSKIAKPSTWLWRFNLVTSTQKPCNFEYLNLLLCDCVFVLAVFDWQVEQPISRGKERWDIYRTKEVCFFLLCSEATGMLMSCHLLLSVSLSRRACSVHSVDWRFGERWHRSLPDLPSLLLSSLPAPQTVSAQAFSARVILPYTLLMAIFSVWLCLLIQLLLYVLDIQGNTVIL